MLYSYSWFLLIPMATILINWIVLFFNRSNERNVAKVNQIFAFIFVFVAFFTIFRGVQLLFRLYDTREQVYWHLLAEAFNQGRLYIENPPSTHDLTLFAGRWYVPNPPLPALVLMPVVALFTTGVNMMVVSALIGVINVGIVYCILRLASEKRMTETSLSANLWITAVFA